ncbi:hypothetical protein DMJ13_17165 [halophilic archaeon]|nr:hypothetical protein DMJ13_17165 [halophilic archaeon]
MSAARIRERLPVQLSDWRITVRAVRLVLSIPSYAILAAISSLVGLSLFVLSQNIPLVQAVIIGGSLPLDQRLTVLFNLYPVVGTAFSTFTTAFLLISAGLFGTNIAMVVYHFREHRVSVSGGTGSALGAVLGTLGAGCAACGSALIAGVLSLIGATSLLALLPFDGHSFSVLSFVVLIFSIYWISDGMRGGTVKGCPVDMSD